MQLLDLLKGSGVGNRYGGLLRKQPQPSHFVGTQPFTREHSQDTENLPAESERVTHERANALSMQPVIAANPLFVVGRV
jgi:hypothetical protein